MVSRSAVSLMLALAAAACSVGPNPGALAPATGPNGTRAHLLVGVGDDVVERSGELIAVRENDLLLLTEEGLLRVPNSGLREGTFDDARPGSIEGSGSDRDRRRLAQFSRYPFGLTEDQLERLLAALGQDGLMEADR